MTDLIELLESFNRKERYFLIKESLGGFELCNHFRSKLSEAIGVSIPDSSYLAMDYDLECIAASVLAHEQSDGESNFDRTYSGFPNSYPDVDLLIAYRDGEDCHIILVEAKGYTGWLNKQLQTKADYLRFIFGVDGKKHPKVTPHFCLLSPRQPTGRLETEGWPEWMTKSGGSPYWLEMTLPKDRRGVTRNDSNNNKLPPGEVRIKAIPSRRHTTQLPACKPR